MCGIAGILALSETSLDPRGNTVGVTSMIDALVHRGPDDGGVWHDADCTLGHRRLAIIDLTSSGRQPMASDDDLQLQIVFNGEIYNYQQLRRTLESAGARFRTRTDTEVLLRAYAKWGESCVDHLRGMFAFAIWDGRRRRLMLARDRVGKKPLFYAEHAGKLYFGSELQSILANPEIPRSLNRLGIDHYLSYGYIPSPESGFLGIHKLPPAHYGLWERGKKSVIERYWKLSYQPRSEITEVEAIAELRERMTEAVRLRLVSDVPVGAFLSGGIDSSIVVGLMAGLSSRPVKTYSIGFRDERFNELPHARRVADRWGTDHHEMIVEPDALTILPRLIRHFGEPFADVSAIPTYYVAEATRRHVTVALNGDGGDESFAGYERYLGNYLAERIHRFPGGRLISSLASRLLPDSLDPRNRVRQVKRFLQTAAMPMRERYPRWLTYFSEAEKRVIYAQDSRIDHDNLLGRLLEELPDLDPVSRAMAVDVGTYLPDDLLVKVDITTMANGLEARSPFLDHEVMELAARLPAEIRTRGRVPKYILKRAFADLLPEENLHRRKMGFGVPVGEWFRGPLKELLRGTLLDSPSGLLARPAIENLVADHLSHRKDLSFQLWNLLVLEMWLASIGFKN